jgi:hypothetical protein
VDHLKSGQKSPDFKWSGFKLNSKTEHGPVFGCSLYLKTFRVFLRDWGGTTVKVRIPDIRIPDTFENQTNLRPVF